ncbi:hypothetical protein TEA_015696 [Camellia sinensis var. sinensis]|uniref:Histone-lysine N-methyltransferase n=1 Tax=Camellia sinensis var. sinensis TaxID=542762 RepID=A0A4S4D5H9_CAMSN|nr:hypothetical protein TEA_015696 [Camellia sinensis var. sinensis]
MAFTAKSDVEIEVVEPLHQEDEIEKTDSPIRYAPLCDLYSSTSNTIMSKKVKARKLIHHHHHHHHHHPSYFLSLLLQPPIIHVYSRRHPKRIRHCQSNGLSLAALKVDVREEERVEEEEDDGVERLVQKKKQKTKGRRFGRSELVSLGVDSSVLRQLDDVPRLRESRNLNYSNVRRRRKGATLENSQNFDETQVVNSAAKRWVGLMQQIYWPLDNDWYMGRVVGYDAETDKHHVLYEDGDKENIILSNETVKFYVSHDELEQLNLSCNIKTSDRDIDFNEMVMLAASFNDCHELGPGDIVWAKITGHAMWPAIVVDESLLGNRRGLNRNSGGKSFPVQFFGTHDFARVNTKQVNSFLRGLLSSFHLKCKKPNFVQSLEEAKIFFLQFKGSTPSACWNKIHKRIRKRQDSSNGFIAKGGFEGIFDSGSDMFGFSNPEVLKLIQELSNSKLHSKSSLSKLTSRRLQDLPIGCRPVHVKWKDLDKCNVCHMDEVHAKCYGELEPVDGVLWLCNLCCPGAPKFPPRCCLCPVIGGAMKPTTDGRWAHLACAIWIPETCLSDIKKMEPIDGLSRINKDRWKLLCSICGVSYGACIQVSMLFDQNSVQCSNNTCRVAYHPLCARAAGFCVELEDEDRLHLISMDDDDDDEQCIRLLSYCKKHRPPSSRHLTADDQIVPIARQYSDYSPPSNPSGCARSEPYNYFGRRGRKEPEALAAVSLKRLFVENRPYLIGGCCQHDALRNTLSSAALSGSKFSFGLQKLKTYQLDAPKSIISMAEKYKYMRETFRKRLAFGKSGIHGFGIFAKQPHRAGDMVIEYTGEVVRPSVADRREHLIYNSMVGAGTYMFRIDDERVIDATRAGSIAHLINHSCEGAGTYMFRIDDERVIDATRAGSIAHLINHSCDPNCYSRVISVNGDEHIIIFAKRDIEHWEELTYDYSVLKGVPNCMLRCEAHGGALDSLRRGAVGKARLRFFSIDEQLACYCGFPRCRGVVNDIEAEVQVTKLKLAKSLTTVLSLDTPTVFNGLVAHHEKGVVGLEDHEDDSRDGSTEHIDDSDEDENIKGFGSSYCSE